MGIRFACHACGRRLNVKQQLAGRRGRCPQCGVWFRVPTEDADRSIPIDPAQAAADQRQPSAERPDDSLRWIDQHPAAQWYVRPRSGGQYGPADGPLLRQWIAEQRLAPDSLLWREGWPQWREARELMRGFGQSPALAPPPVAPPPPPVAAPTAVAGPAAELAAAENRLPVDESTPASAIAPLAGSLAGGPAGAGRPPEPPGKVRRKRTARRTMIVGVLLAISLLLLAALTVVLVMQPAAVEV